MASSRQHAWENYGWDAAGYDESGGWEDSGSEAGEPTAAEAGELLADLLVRLRLSGTLSAKQACLLAHWAFAAGACGPVSEFALRPGLPSGHYQRRLDAYLGVSEDAKEFYLLDVPGHNPSEGWRATQTVETVPPHEALHRELAGDPSVLERVREGASNGEWAGVYDSHPVVLASPPGTVVPLALYFDGVPYTKLDGFLAFWIVNLVTMKRHLAAVLRKSTMCACGCKRWCSLHPVFAYLNWSFLALARGFHPAARHDGRDWLEPSDTERRAAAGQPLPRCAVVLVKGDWAEFTTTLGFPTWAHGRHPCLFCHASRDGLYSVENFSPLEFPAPLKDDASYAAACAAAERRVVLSSPADHRVVRAALRYDKRRDGARGRALAHDLPALGLLRGDRLEPCPELTDVAQFDGIAEFPVSVLFWRRSAETWAWHRNPLFCRETGVGFDTLAIDVLHTLNLGLYQKLVAKVFWTLLLGNAWGLSAASGGRMSQEELVANGCMRLRTELWAWYQEQEQARPQERLARLGDLTVKTLGEQAAVCTRTKAAETRPLVQFCAVLVERYRAALPRDNPALAPAAAALSDFVALLRQVPRVLQPPHLQALHDGLKRYVTLAVRAGVPLTPKVHLSMHLVHRTPP